MLPAAVRQKMLGLKHCVSMQERKVVMANFNNMLCVRCKYNWLSLLH